MKISRPTNILLFGFALTAAITLTSTLHEVSLIYVVDAFGVAMGFAVILTYLPAVKGLDWGGMRPGHLLIAGVILSWLGIVARLMTLWFLEPGIASIHLGGKLLLTSAAWFFVLGGTIQLVARSGEAERASRSCWIALGIVVVSGALVTAASTLYASQ